MKGNKNIKDFLDIVSNVMEAYSVILLNTHFSKKNTLILNSYQSFSKNIEEDCLIEAGEGMVGWCFREQKSVVANNFERDTKTLKFYNKDEKIKSLMAVPLKKERGVLYVDSKKSYIFTEKLEKIFHQMAETAFSLLQLNNEIEDKKYLKIYLKIALEFNQIVFESANREELMHRFFGLLFDNLSFAKIILYASDNYLCLTEKNEKEPIRVKKLSADFLSSEGLLSWCINNMKIIKKNNILSNKTFIFNKDENIGNMTNFVGIPVVINKNNKGCIGLEKRNKDEWNKVEIDILANLGHIFIKEWFKR